MNASPLSKITLSLPGGACRLETLDAAHAEELFAAAHDPVIWKYIPHPYGGVSSLTDMRSLIARALEAEERGTELPFAIIETKSGRAIGSTRYLDIQPGNRALEIGATWIDPRSQRSAVNTECKYLLLRHAFESLWPAAEASRAGAERVQLKCDGRNVKSQAAILRIGAVYEGTLRRHRVLTDGFVRDTAYFSVIREEWAEVKRRLERLLR